MECRTPETVTCPLEGSVAMDVDGVFVHGPTQAARTAATEEDRTDFFTVAVSYGDGGGVRILISGRPPDDGLTRRA